jgi:hypothetical protein
VKSNSRNYCENLCALTKPKPTSLTSERFSPASDGQSIWASLRRLRLGGKKKNETTDRYANCSYGLQAATMERSGLLTGAHRTAMPQSSLKGKARLESPRVSLMKLTDYSD